MDEKIQVYIKHVFTILESEQFFENFGLFMDREIFKTFLEETLNSNLEETGDFLLREDQLQEIIEKTTRYLLEETFEDLLKDDLIEVKGMNENGDFLYGPKEK